MQANLKVGPEMAELLQESVMLDDDLGLNELNINESTVKNMQHFHNEQSPTRLQRVVTEAQQKLQADCDGLLRKIQDIYIVIGELLKDKQHPLPAEVTEHLQKQKQILLTRQTQLFMTVFIVNNRQMEGFQQEYLKSFGALGPFKISERLASQPLNCYILEELHSKELTYVDNLWESIASLRTLVSKGKKQIKNLLQVLKSYRVNMSKISTIVEIYPYACTLATSDLFSVNKNLSKRWHNLRECMKIRILGDKKAMAEAFTELTDGLNFVNAMMSKMSEFKSVDPRKPEDFFNMVKGGFSVFQYALFKDKAKKRAQLLISNPNSELAREIWNLPQTGIIKNLVEVGLPKIQYSDVVWVPRHYQQIDASLIASWNVSYNFGLQSNPFQIPSVSQYTREQSTEFWKECKNQNERILVRINSPAVIPKLHKEEPGFFKKIEIFQKLETMFKKNNEIADAVIFHIHGGGFISMSSHVHQAYTRRWANNLKAAIFSLDYRKAPLHPYPEGLDDCFQVYMWIVNHMKNLFEFKHKKIILVGDSAGGNLVASLTALLIKLGLRVPDGIVLAYPALNLNYNNYTPSLLSSLDDMILPHTFLKICLQAYIQDERYKPDTDPFLSPIKCSDDILKKFPSTRIFVGNVDPFHDDCCRLTERLKNLEKDVQLTVYDNFPHGFLQFDNPPKGNKYCKIAIEEVEQALQELIKK